MCHTCWKSRAKEKIEKEKGKKEKQLATSLN